MFLHDGGEEFETEDQSGFARSAAHAISHENAIT